MRLAGYYHGSIDGIIGVQSMAAMQQWDFDEQQAKNEYGTFDERTESNLSTLLPVAQKHARKWLNSVMVWAAKNGLVVKIICGTRTYAEQDALYAQGRTKKGAKITNAKGGYSLHNFCVAFDLGIFQAGKYLESDTQYKKLYQACGAPDKFTWGGNWKSIVDTPHYQYNAFGESASAIRAKFLA